PAWEDATQAVPPSATQPGRESTPQQPVAPGALPPPAIVRASAAPTIPSPAKPAAPATPPFLKAALFVLVALVAGAVRAAAAFVLGRAGKLASGCVSGATCASMDLPDPTHVDPQAILPAVEKLAKGMDERASFTIITVMEVARDGTADVTGDRGITYGF